MTITGTAASTAVLDANLASAVASYRTYVETETQALGTGAPLGRRSGPAATPFW